MMVSLLPLVLLPVALGVLLVLVASVVPTVAGVTWPVIATVWLT
jgi:hypothetical protein